MNRENARKWIDALRSGNYAQTASKLRKDNSFCCLGVACELAIADGVEVEVKTHSDFYYHNFPASDSQKVEYTVYEYDGTEGVLPPRVREWLGTRDENPDFTIPFPDRRGAGPNQYASLAGLNDAGFTFDQIADMIEYFLMDDDNEENVTEGQSSSNQ